VRGARRPADGTADADRIEEKDVEELNKHMRRTRHLTLRASIGSGSNAGRLKFAKDAARLHGSALSSTSSARHLMGRHMRIRWTASWRVNKR